MNKCYIIINVHVLLPNDFDSIVIYTSVVRTYACA